MVVASDRMVSYFNGLEQRALKEYEIAKTARAMGFDPHSNVEVTLARNIGERVEGLVSAVYKNLKGSGLAPRIMELEKEFGVGDWRVVLQVAKECAEARFIKLDEKIKLFEIGMRVGLAYATQGTVSAPLEGLINCKEKQRKDGGTYVAIYYAGPIRAAGGTAAALSVIVADYLRNLLGYDSYDPTDLEFKRYYHELEIYNERVSRLQYFPTEKEADFLIHKIPVEINGFPTTNKTVILFKEADRVETPRVRGGMCLVLAEAVAQKAKKLLGGLKKFEGFNELDNWRSFLEEFVKLQKEIYSASANSTEEKKETKEKVPPNFKYLKDAVAGRPIFSHPSNPYGFRIRYGRTRVSGSESLGFNPVSTKLLNNFLAIGTQMAVERPGKGCSISVCEVVRGPIIKTFNGDVVELFSDDDLIKYKNNVKEILFLGDVLVPYGAFREHKHILVPAPFVEEWWVKYLPIEHALRSNPFQHISYALAKELSLSLNIPLHPDFLFRYSLASADDLLLLVDWFSSKRVNQLVEGNVSFSFDGDIKVVLEKILIPHEVIDRTVVLKKDVFDALSDTFALSDPSKIKSLLSAGGVVLDIINKVAPFQIKNITGYAMGARMGRPEKAKMRKLSTSPHMLFAVGDQGGRLRSLNAAFDEGFVESNFPIFYCTNCNAVTILGVCERCNSRTKEWYVCSLCKSFTSEKEHCNAPTRRSNHRVIDIVSLTNAALKHVSKKISGNTLVEKDAVLSYIVKGVRGTSSDNHIIEPLEKGLLRAFHSVFVNKDGTIRLDMSEQPITHFKPCEIGTSVPKLIELGYDVDYLGAPLVSDEQIVEIKPQDIILPQCTELPETNIAKEILNITKFIDSLLESLYGLPAFYNSKSIPDLVGILGVALAPHTSAGTIVRVIGFSKTQSFLAHPLLHAACRRDCDGDELGLIILMDALLNFSHDYLPNLIGTKNMDAPLVLALTIDTSTVDDEVYNFDVVSDYPIEFYEATQNYLDTSTFKLEVVENRLETPLQYESYGFTHPVVNFNNANHVSAYKLIPTMDEKVEKQMDLAFRVRAAETSHIAELVIERHFLRDIKGNLRKFSSQVFRCVKCNTKYRRVPLAARCSCGGNLTLTIHEGSVVKYLKKTMDLAHRFEVNDYLMQSLNLLEKRIESVFGKQITKQEGLAKFFIR